MRELFVGSIEYIENLGIMMNWLILQFSKESNKTESILSIEQLPIPS